MTPDPSTATRDELLALLMQAMSDTIALEVRAETAERKLAAEMEFLDRWRGRQGKRVSQEARYLRRNL